MQTILMRHLPSSFRVVILLAAVLMLGACSSGPPPKLYLLESIYDLALEEAAPKVSAVGLAVVTLPGYAQDARIASRVEQQMVSLDDRHRWAEAPEDAITRVMADKLRNYTGASVLTEPWPRGFAPEVRVEVVFDKLLRDATGGAEMSGQISIISGDARRVLSVMPFQLVNYADNTEPVAFFRATAAGINEISRMATQTMREFFEQ